MDATLQRDSLFALIPFGSAHGLFEGASGVARTVYKNPNRPGEWNAGGQELGRATVYALDDSVAYVVIELADSTDAGHLLYEGDMVELATDLPPRAYRSVFFDFIRLGITFQDNDGSSLFSRNSVLGEDSPELEASLEESMTEQTHQTADLIRDIIPDNPQWDIDITGGRFAGMKMVDAMAASTPSDIHAFLLFVRSYPGKYLGQDWKINETYATWLINEAPPSEEEMRVSLLAKRGTRAFTQLIEEYRDDLSDGVFTSTWNDHTIPDWASGGRIDEAYALSYVVEDISNALNDEDLKGWTYYARADVAKTDDDYDGEIEWYRKAIDTFRKSLNRQGEEVSVNNLGSSFNRQDRFTEGLALFDEVIALRKSRATEEMSEVFFRNFAGSYFGRGTSLRGLGRFEEALSSYRIADSLYASGLSFTSQRSHGNTLVRIAKTLRNLSRFEEARVTLDKAAKQYSRLGLQEGEADALDELGFLLATVKESEEAREAFGRAYELHVATDHLRDAGYSMSQIGQMEWQLKHFDLAIEAHRKAIQLREQSGDKSGVAYSYTKLGGLFKDAGDPNSAIEAYDKAAGIYRNIGNTSGSADVLENLGDLYVAEGDYDRGAETHKKALALRESLGARNAVATSLSDIAGALFSGGKYSEAGTYYRRSADLRRAMNDRAGLARELSNLGNIAHYQDRDYDGAMTLYNEAIEIATEIDSRSDLAYCYRGLGRIFVNRGSNDEALAYYQKAHELESDPSDLVSSLLAIGSIYQTWGRFDLANERYADAVSIADSANSRRDLAAAFNALGGLNRLMGSLSKSLQYGMRSLQISEEVQNPWGMAVGHIAVGNTYNEMGANELAISNYIFADSLYEKAGFGLARATPLNNIGTIHFHQGDYSGSISLFKQALRIQTDARIRDEFTVIIQANIGESLLEMDQLSEGEPWMMRALGLADSLKANRIGASVRNIYGRLRMKQERLDDAESFFRESIRLSKASGEQREEIGAASRLGDVLALTGRMEEAKVILTESASRARQLGLKRYLWRPLASLGRIEREAGRLEEAARALKESVQTIEELKTRLAFGDDARKNYTKEGERSRAYEDLIALLIQQGKTDLALGYVERSHNEALRKQWSNLDVQFSDAEKTAALRSRRELQSQLEELDRQIAKQKSEGDNVQNVELIASLETRREIAEKDYVGFVNRTVRKYPKLKEYLSDSVNPKELARAKRNIPDDTAVLAYLVGESHTFLFVANSDTVRAVAVAIGEQTVNRLTNTVADGLQQPAKGNQRGAGAVVAERPDSAGFNAALQDLYDLLIAPINEAIAGRKILAVIPSGALLRLPFQILAGDNGEMLVDHHTIFYTTTLNIFQDSPEPTRPRVVAFGNPDSSLTWSEREVSDIADVLLDTRVFIRQDATEDRVKDVSPDFNVLHLATHGTLDYNEFENSYLTLAVNQEKQEDGRLTISEIWGMDSLDNYRLVTLSACETAVSDDVTDGWPISPANAFLDHVPTVIASLWPVDDIATSKLMQAFYRNLETNGTAEALRLAQLSLADSEDFSDPYYWAPFVVMGDWR